MRIDTGQHMRIDQRMKLAPRMIQSMEILQMTQQALEERIEQELASNPTLELREPGFDRDEIEAQRNQEERDNREGERELIVDDENQNKQSNVDDFERLSNISEEYGEAWDANTYETGEYRHSYINRYSGERDAKLDAMANTEARALPLYEQLIAQWHLLELDHDVMKAGELLIGHIDDDGYLRTDLATILNQAPKEITDQTLEQALQLLQHSLEPAGIGARDLRECLLMQIDARQKQDPDTNLEIERVLVAEFLKDIEVNRLPKISKALDISIDQIKAAISNLKQFHMHPGRLLSSDSPCTITPDAIIEYDEENEHYTAMLTYGRMPALHINPTYKKMLRDTGVEKKTREFITNNLRSAGWLIDAIRQRNHTLLRVIQVVIEAQRDFFEQGPQALHPLPMTVVADQLGVHVATVSRAVHEKYIQTPRGIFPLRMFFSGGTETEAGDAMSWAAIQAKLEQIINEEDKHSPLNDDQLVEKLKEHGIDIARRTVAKYRKQLDIPPARQRKQY